MSKRTNKVGAVRVYRSLRPTTVGSEWVERWVVSKGIYILLGTVGLFVPILFPGDQDLLAQLVLWGAVYALYSVFLMFVASHGGAIYDQPLFKETRIHVHLVMLTLLVFITSGSRSPFWPLYVLPILSAVISIRTWKRIAGFIVELIGAYALACWLSSQVNGLLDLGSLLWCSAVLAFITATFYHILGLWWEQARIAGERLSARGQVSRPRRPDSERPGRHRRRERRRHYL